MFYIYCPIRDTISLHYDKWFYKIHAVSDGSIKFQYQMDSSNIVKVY